MDEHFSRQRKDSRPPRPAASGQGRPAGGRGGDRPAKRDDGRSPERRGDARSPARRDDGRSPAKRGDARSPARRVWDDVHSSTKQGDARSLAGRQGGEDSARRSRAMDVPQRNATQQGKAPRGQTDGARPVPPKTRRPQSEGSRPVSTKERYPQAEFARREGLLEELPAAMLVNRSLKGYPFCKDFPWCLRLVVAYRADSVSGLPLPKEERMLEHFEQNLFSLLKKNVNGHYIGHTSWRGSREFIFYVDEGSEAEDPLEAFAANQKRELEFALEQDPRWTHAAHYFDYQD